MELWVGWIVRWILTDLGAWVTDVNRFRVFDTREEALGHARWLLKVEGVGRVRAQFIMHEYHDVCEICDDIYGRGHDHEGPTCGVCDAVGHDTNNCRSGDAPYDYAEDMAEREAELWAAGSCWERPA